MTQNNEPNMTKLSRTKTILLYLAVAVAIAMVLFSSFGVKWMAEQKAQTPDNLLTGCLQFEGRSINKTYINFSIEGIKTTERKGFLKQFSINNQPLEPSITEFTEYVRTHPDACHRVEYVKIDGVFFNKVYVASYLGSER